MGAEEQLEVEDKFEVEAGFGLPDLTGLLPAGGRWETDDFQIENTYFDTPSAYLAQFGVSVRRREGGPDAGWHLKVPDSDGRIEISVASESSAVPEEVSRLVVGLRGGEELVPIAQVSVARTAHRLVGADGSVMVEVADDRVDGLTMGDATRISNWREVEVELKPDGNDRLAKQVGKMIRTAGGNKSDFASKLQRTLGGGVDDVRTKSGCRTVGGLARAYLEAQCQEIVRCDIGLRLSQPLVHKFRVAIRRLRSTLRVFAPLFDAGASAELEPELIWFAGLLGEVRDRDILMERLTKQLKELPPEVVLGSVASHIQTTLLLERSEHQARIVEAMDSDRYQMLMKALLHWQTAPPMTKRAGKAVTTATRYVNRAAREVDQRLASADGNLDALHNARKAAKRYRYAAELTARAGDKKAARIVKATTKLQTLLGEHQDSVVSAAFLRRMGAEASVGGEQNGFTYGFLMANEWQRADQVRHEAAKRWGNSGR